MSDDHMTPEDFDKARNARPNQGAMAEIVMVAQEEAASILLSRSHAGWQEESNAWQRLADAAYACESILIRRHLSFLRGTPGDTGGKEAT